MKTDPIREGEGRRERIGIFGGTFNPIHNGHLHLLKETQAALSFDKILLIPAGIPPHKAPKSLASGADRLEMARLAAMEMENVSVSDIELKSGGRSYTIHTLLKLKTLFPEAAFTLIMGADMLLSFDQWYRWRDILALASLAAAARSDGEYESLVEKGKALGRTQVVRLTPFPVSSTQVREKLAAGEDVSGLLPHRVLSYILKKGLYQSEREV